MATLFHWDLPQALQDRRRVAVNRATAERFAEYAALVGAAARRPGRALVPGQRAQRGDACSATRSGDHAPGLSLMFDALPVAHHLNLGHGLAVPGAARRPAPPASGAANNHTAGLDGQRRRPPTSAAAGLYDATCGTGCSPTRCCSAATPTTSSPMVEAGVQDGDLATIRAAPRLLRRQLLQPDPDRRRRRGRRELPFERREIAGYPTTDFGWPVVPDGLRELLGLAQERYAEPCRRSTSPRTAAPTAWDPTPTGVVDDQPRIDYLDAHLRAVAQAIEEGVDVRGYYTLVPDGQLRVGRGLHPAVRAGARRLRHPGAHPEALLRVVRRDDRRQPPLIAVRYSGGGL